jgi:hypothetical protein
MEPPLAADVPPRRVATRRHLIPYDNLPQVTEILATESAVSHRRRAAQRTVSILEKRLAAL